MRELGSLGERRIDSVASGGSLPVTGPAFESGVAVLTSATDSQLAQERLELGHGLFTYALLEGLRGAADQDGDGVELGELGRYVSYWVREHTGDTQTPALTGSFDSELPFAESD
jgi:uncharacterized caspase-like protein